MLYYNNLYDILSIHVKLKGVGTITQPNIKIVVVMSNALESNPHK